MGQQPNELTPHASLHHYWGAELRAVRTARGLSLAELGRRVHCNPSYLAKIERAERPIPAHLAASCDRELATSGALVRLHALAESHRDRKEKPTDHVAGADAHVALWPGNLDDEITVPTRTSDGRVVFVSVPRRAFLHGLGSAALGVAATTGALPSTTPIPDLGDVHPADHFRRLRQELVDNGMLFGPRQVISVVREQVAVMQRLRNRSRGADRHALVREQAQYSELCGWLHKDLCEHQFAESWLDRALGLSHLTEDRKLTAYVLASKAELAGDMRVAADAIGAGEQALRTAPPHSHLAALAATRAARGHAISGDRAATERTYDQARNLLDASDKDPESPGGHWLTVERITLSQAHSRTILGEYRRAAENFQNALADVPRSARLSRGTYLARAALANAGDHEVENAATLGQQALSVATETQSGRMLTELIRLDDALARWQKTPRVADFHTSLHDTLSHQT